MKEAAYEPLRVAIRARYFKKAGEGWRACSPSDEGGVEMRLWEVPENAVEVGEIEMDDFYVALNSCKCSVGDVGRYEEWSEHFGQWEKK